MHIEPRPGGAAAATVVVLHTNEGPEAQNGAAGLANYLRNISGGYHKVIDNAHAVTLARYDQLVWGASGMNEHGEHVCLIGFAAQSPAEWADAYSKGELDVAAHEIATICRDLRIPARMLTDDQLRRGERGITTHAQVNRAIFHGDHWDPGPNFPLAQLVGHINLLLGAPRPPAPAPVPPTIRMGSRGDVVKLWQTLLNNYAGQRLVADGVFGNATLAATQNFQRFWKMTVDGVVGPKTWAWMLTLVQRILASKK